MPLQSLRDSSPEGGAKRKAGETVEYSVKTSFPKKPDYSINEMFKMAAERTANEISKVFNMPVWAARYVAKAGSFYYEDGGESASVTVEIETEGR